MKRSLLVLTAAAVVLTPLAATAAPAKATKRTVTFDYRGFSSIGAAGAGLHYAGLVPVCAAANSCWELETVKGEKTVEIKASSPNIGLQIWYDGTYAATVQMYCGAAKFNVSPKTAHTINIRTSLGDCGGVPTEGKLSAVITGTR